MNEIIDILKIIFNLIFNFYAEIGDSVYNFYLSYSRLILDYMHIFFDTLFYILLYITIILTLTYFMMGVYLLLNKNKQKEKPVKDSDLPFVTIQIPTYNELVALNCARKCLDFDYPKSKYEIIIGDDSSDKSISEKIDEFARMHKSRIKVTRRKTNAGFKPGNLIHMLNYSNGEYIVIFDSDFLPEQDFLRRIIAPFIHDKCVSAVQARWKTGNFSQTLAAIIGGTIPIFTHYFGLPFLNRVNSNTFIGGSAEAIRKKDLIELGGWRSGALTEDIEYSLKLTNAGKKIVYLETLECLCEAPFTLVDLCKQQMRWAYGVITAIKMYFWEIFTNKKLHFKDKINMFLLLSGYLTTLFYFLLAVTGLLSIITHRPEIIMWAKFISETTLNIILTSGFLLTLMITFILSNKTKEIPKLILASFSVGLVVIGIVTLGVFRAIFNREMNWFMLRKKGNLSAD
ncbi:glycosyltransferase family 2 protein [Candidatus Woesearchaeota archaeon]|nr:glycosyltransferase family 2 protein [Candidatus Woesearchaeota archaeon]